jgi:hypothetical protein
VCDFSSERKPGSGARAEDSVRSAKCKKRILPMLAFPFRWKEELLHLNALRQN